MHRRRSARREKRPLSLRFCTDKLDSPDYRAPAWLPGGHTQTLYAPCLKGRHALAYRRERWDTPDGDFIDLDWLDGPETAPLVVLFHGLEGSSRSHYALAMAGELARHGWRGVFPHFRGCSGEPNRHARAYHSGDSVEIDWILRRLSGRSGGPVFAAGISLGGNALLKWLGERGASALSVIRAAGAASVPLDLAVCGDWLGQGFNRLYTWHFLNSLKRKSLQKLERHPGIFDRNAMLSARTLREFDDVVTAPLHGFLDTDDYWRRASSKPWLPHVAVPALLISALNDPFVPAHALPAPERISRHVTLCQPDQGGHAGFVEGRFPGHLGWLPRKLIRFFEASAPAPQRTAPERAAVS